MFEIIVPLLKPILPIIGVICGVLGILLYLPQITRAYRTKSTMDIAKNTYRLILVNDIFWTIYGMGINNLFVFIPNAISIGLCITILIQKNIYDNISRTSR